MGKGRIQMQRREHTVLAIIYNIAQFLPFWLFAKAYMPRFLLEEGDIYHPTVPPR